MKGHNLFLDDFRRTEDAYGYTNDVSYKALEWEIVRSYDEFVSFISERYTEGSIPKLISFDHDLADVHYESANSVEEIDYDKYKEKTGYHCAKWLIEFCMNNDFSFPEYLIHSMNFIGRQNIDSIIKSYQKVTE